MTPAIVAAITSLQGQAASLRLNAAILVSQADALAGLTEALAQLARGELDEAPKASPSPSGGLQRIFRERAPRTHFMKPKESSDAKVDEKESGKVGRRGRRTGQLDSHEEVKDT